MHSFDPSSAALECLKHLSPLSKKSLVLKLSFFKAKYVTQERPSVELADEKVFFKKCFILSFWLRSVLEPVRR